MLETITEKKARPIPFAEFEQWVVETWQKCLDEAWDDVPQRMIDDYENFNDIGCEFDTKLG